MDKPQSQCCKKQFRQRKQALFENDANNAEDSSLFIALRKMRACKQASDGKEKVTKQTCQNMT